MTPGTAIQPNMPQYRSHKIVHAFKIRELHRIAEDCGGGAALVPEDERFDRFIVDADYLAKHSPHPGSYYVVYQDGYTSFSPEKAFEEGYTLVGSETIEQLLEPSKTRTLSVALEASLHLQSHYAKLLNEYDGGKRMVFDNADRWLARLQEIG